MWGSCAFCHTFPEECGALVGDSLVIVPGRTPGYISAQWNRHKCSQVFVESIIICRFFQATKTNPHHYPRVDWGGGEQGLL